MKFTIITACRNNENTIEDTIKSVCSQTYKDIEYLIIDGKSDDKTLEIAEKYADKISKIVSEKDGGIYHALNKGIEMATGDIIGFIHADDFYENEFVIEKISKRFIEENFDSAYADLCYVDKENTQKIIRYWKSGEFSLQKMKNGWMPPHPTFFVKKNIYEKFGKFDTRFSIAGDYDCVLRFLYKNKISVFYLPQTIIKMRVGGASNKSLKNIFRKMKEDLAAMSNNNVGGIFTLLSKNLRKIPQLFIK